MINKFINYVKPNTYARTDRDKEAEIREENGRHRIWKRETLTGNGMERYRGGIRLENGRQRIREMKFIKWNVHGGFSYIQNRTGKGKSLAINMAYSNV